MNKYVWPNCDDPSHISHDLIFPVIPSIPAEAGLLYSQSHQAAIVMSKAWTFIIFLLISLCVTAHVKSQEYDSLRVNKHLNRIISLPPVSQSELDSMSFRLQQLTRTNEIPSDDACTEIALLRSNILKGCMNGMKSSEVPSLLLGLEPCSPDHGINDFIAGNIYFTTQQWVDAENRFLEALEKLGVQHKISVMIQLNLAAVYDQTKRHDQAIDSLVILLDEESHWRESPAIVDNLYGDQIRINAAAIMINLNQFHRALDLIKEQKPRVLSDYWRTILTSNEYIAQKNLANFIETDSIWNATLQFIPADKLPPKMLHQIMGTLLATNNLEYIQSIRTNPELASAVESISDFSSYNLFYAPSLSEEIVQQNWSVARTLNDQERQRFQSFKDYFASPKSLDSKEDLFADRLQALSRQTHSWQIASVLLFVLITSTFGFSLIKSRRKQRQIESGIEKLAQTPVDSDSRLGISSDEIRKIYDGLTKGLNIGDALMALRKIEILHPNETRNVGIQNLSQIDGVRTLTELEQSILVLSANGVPAKEIAHQLRVSPGYVYNTRSAIRSKLAISRSLTLEAWIQSQIPD